MITIWWLLCRHSLSQKTPGNSKSGNRQENGSIAEEIDDEEIDEDISIEADDLLQSEKSGVRICLDFDLSATVHKIFTVSFEYLFLASVSNWWKLNS